MRIDYPKSFKKISSIADITFSTQMGKAADKMVRWGAKNIVLSPLALCQVRFKAHSINIKKHKFEYDVVFLGSNNGNRLLNPISKHWWGAKARQKLVNSLYKKFGYKFGLYGYGWELPIAKGGIAFNDQQMYFQKGRIVIDANPYSFSDYYLSNRPFFAIASGIPTVELYVPRLDKIFRDKEHVYFANDIDHVVETVDKLLKLDKEELYTKAAQAAKYVEEKHTQYHRMKFELEVIKNYINNKDSLKRINFPFFLEDINLEIERKFATREVL